MLPPKIDAQKIFAPSERDLTVFDGFWQEHKTAIGDRPLTTSRRDRLPDSDFALPGRRYPIDTAARARNALARVAQFGSEWAQRMVRAAVRRRWPEIEVTEPHERE